MLAFYETRKLISRTTLISTCSTDRNGKADNYSICTQRDLNVFMLRMTLSMNPSAKH